MTLDSYLFFVSASILLCLVPGPDMAYLLGRSIAQGRRAGLLSALGINLGGYFHLAAAVLGLSAILATSSFAFTLVKWAGAAYLIYLGLQALFGKSALRLNNTSGFSKQSGRKIFWQGFVSDALNPKVAIFFLAFLPQFIDPNSQDRTSQLILLGVTVNVVCLFINFALVWFATRVTRRLRHNSSIATWLTKSMGLVLVGLGARLASEKL